ncbi:SDR family oxidoreductase (plasmid) [Rhodococcus sp. USK10]|uniref:SDR family oxidoreductase n=1 Tax=Rhodococcus sp. USK10 TaxID=2789739 RepID=UPI001C5E38CF|nr:SDR family oxidoreductase [Rhodococcus sp. USK10]QYB00205.1 SDR family oxidoreductase [Rhodococcus sp. USK10]
MTTWFITGTSTGFGRTMSEKLIARGDRVAATLRQPHQLDDLAATAGERLWVRKLDVTDPQAVDRVVAEAFSDLGTIDVVVNNAGYGTFGAVEELTREQIRRSIDTNLLGSIDVIKAALPYFRAQQHGRILQVSSAGGQAAYPGFAAYHAAKWGIEGFCEAIAPELAALGIEITIVEPGASPTQFTPSRDDGTISAAYDNGPVGEVRRAIISGAFPQPNDPAKIAQAMIDLATNPEPTPIRLPLGEDTDVALRDAYTQRLAEHNAHQALALSVGLD